MIAPDGARASLRPRSAQRDPPRADARRRPTRRRPTTREVARDARRVAARGRAACATRARPSTRCASASRRPTAASYVRDGFFALLHLEDYARRIVRPHERTLAGPKADRLKHPARDAREPLERVPALRRSASDALDATARAPRSTPGPLAVARDDGGRRAPARARRRPARASRRARASSRERPRRDRRRPPPLRDGARLPRRAARAPSRGAGPDAPFEFMLAYFANAYAPGTLLLPIHRVVREGAGAGRRGLGGAAARAGSSERVALPERRGAARGCSSAHLAPLADRHAFAADDGSGTLRIFSRARAAGDELSIARAPPRGDRGRLRPRRGRRARGRGRLPEVRRCETARDVRARPRQRSRST